MKNVVVIHGIHPQERSAYIVADELKGLTDAKMIDATGVGAFNVENAQKRIRYYLDLLKGGADFLVDLHGVTSYIGKPRNYSELRFFNKDLFRSLKPKIDEGKHFNAIRVNDVAGPEKYPECISYFYLPEPTGYCQKNIYRHPWPEMFRMVSAVKVSEKYICHETLYKDESWLRDVCAPQMAELIESIKRI